MTSDTSSGSLLGEIKRGKRPNEDDELEKLTDGNVRPPFGDEETSPRGPRAVGKGERIRRSSTNPSTKERLARPTTVVAVHATPRIELRTGKILRKRKCVRQLRSSGSPLSDTPENTGRHKAIAPSRLNARRKWQIITLQDPDSGHCWHTGS
ncbi:hypothetical protein KM043_003280 [Ampulex compressa]|nr:hypothetical protein KM043_003280 [Ampulex compressa]